jgi:hypothetical protein
MKNRAPTLAAAAAALVLMAGAADAAPRGGNAKGKSPKALNEQMDPARCMSSDLQLVLTPEGLQARLVVEWKCPDVAYAADLSLEMDGWPIPGATAYVEDASHAEVAHLLDPARLAKRFEICGRVEAYVQQQEQEQEVLGLECRTYDGRKVQLR